MVRPIYRTLVLISEDQHKQEEKKIKEKIEELYHANRNLGEALHAIHFVRRKPFITYWKYRYRR